jgi:predicted TIM-barrel fold metal-dependent hydrolase
MNVPIVDVNVSFSRWPTRRIVEDEPQILVSKLKANGIVEAWVGSFDGLLHRDLSAVNARLDRDCKEQDSEFLRPFGSINPMLPDWQEDLHRCHRQHRMLGIRVHPNYHGYSLDHPEFVKLVSQATDQKQIVAIAIQMEDERVMHPMLRVRPVDLAPLHDVVLNHPKSRFLLLNAGRFAKSDHGLKLLRSGQVYSDISMLEGLGGLESLLTAVPLERIVFGSHAPYHTLAAAILKVQEASLDAFRSKAVLFENARRLRADP